MTTKANTITMTAAETESYAEGLADLDTVMDRLRFRARLIAEETGRNAEIVTDRGAVVWVVQPLAASGLDLDVSA